MTFAMVDSSSGAASAAAMNPAIDLGAGRQDQHAAHGRLERMQRVLEPGDDAEVPAAAADRPEQVRMMLGIDAQELAVGGHDVGGQERVDRQAVLADQIADTAAERDPADPHGPGVPEAGRQAVGGGRRRVLRCGQPGLRPRGPPLHVDLERLHVPQVQHDPVIDHAVPGPAVAAASDGEREARVARERDDVGDVGRIRGPHDDERPAIDATGHDGPGCVVFGVVGGDHPATDGGAKVRDRDGGWRGGRHVDLLLGRGGHVSGVWREAGTGAREVAPRSGSRTGGGQAGGPSSRTAMVLPDGSLNQAMVGPSPRAMPFSSWPKSDP